MATALATMLVFGTGAVANAQTAVTFANMIVMPADVGSINYPLDYRNALPMTATVADPYCATTTDVVAFPADYLGAFPLPPIVGAPLSPTIRHGAGLKDYWDYGRNNPSTNRGCTGSIRTAFVATVDRLARLGVDHINVSQYAFMQDGSRPELGFVEPSMTADDVMWITATAAARGLKVHQQMQIAGSRTGTQPPNPIPLDWATRFLDAYSDYAVAQARTAAAAGIEGFQLDFCCLAPFVDWSQQPAALLAKMKALADRIRAVFPGKLFYGEINATLVDAELMAKIDWYTFTQPLELYNPPLDNDQLTVGAVKAKLLQVWAGLANQLGPRGIPPKPVKWKPLVQSHRDFFKTGWVEDGFCVNNCSQQTLKTDFSVQAIGYEAWMEAIREQTFFDTASVDPEAYWYVDVILPKDSFPNTSQSWRNKPAESILAAWFKSPLAPVAPVAVIEFYNASLDHYFITWVADEIAKLDAGTVIKGWTRTGKSFPAYAVTQAGTSAVCRIYIPPGKGDGHYFGRDAIECGGTMTKNPTFILESASFFYLFPPNAGTCAAGTAPVYRVFSNRLDANHRYTADRAVRDQMVARGWLAEGDGPDTVVMCSPL